MTSLTHSVKTLVSSTTIVQKFVVPNNHAKLILGQSSRSVKTNNFYLFEEQDFNICRVTERLPMYLTASVYGTNGKKVRFQFNESYSLGHKLVSKIEQSILAAYLSAVAN